MEYSKEFLRMILDSVTEHIVVIDEKGEIQYANRSWLEFGSNNKCTIGDNWGGVSYIKECEKASAMGDDFGLKAGNGIRSVIEKREQAFYLEYPCHSPYEKRWFMMHVTPFQVAGKNYYVISHQNITKRKLAEEEVGNAANIDGLTNIPNRRTFDEFLHQEWRRCLRLRKPISLAMVDIDYFKMLNDTYGHQSGDECLVKVGALLKEFVNRPGDICARYGGEEFVLVWGDTPLEQAKKLSNEIKSGIVDLNIPNKESSTESYLTASIGLGEMIPDRESGVSELISMADRMLYKAKRNGRNRVEY
jgi:diguanylate cyclase (GGDEF)-like protein